MASSELVHLHSELEGPNYDLETLSKRLSDYGFCSATGLNSSNIITAADITPMRFFQYFELSHSERRAELSKLVHERYGPRKRLLDAIEFVPKHLFTRPTSALVAETAGVSVVSGQATLESIWLTTFILDNLDISDGDDVLILGSGPGYGSALCIQMVGFSGTVVSVELDSELAHSSDTCLSRIFGSKRVAVENINAAKYSSLKRYDAIWCTLAGDVVHQIAIDHLKIGGKVALFEKRSPFTLSVKSEIDVKCNIYEKTNISGLKLLATMPDLVNSQFDETNSREERDLAFDSFQESEDYFVKFVNKRVREIEMDT